MKLINAVKPAISIAVFLFLAGAIDAQQCTQSALAQKPGSYSQSGLTPNTRGIAAADLVREKAMLTSIHKMVSEKYSPVGVVAKYDYHYDAGTILPGTVKIADTYGYGMYLLKYNCDKTSADKSKFYVNTETPTILRIDANVIGQYRISTANIADNSFRGYLLLNRKPQKINGFYYLGNEFRGDPRANQKNYTWLVTYDDTLPFTSVLDEMVGASSSETFSTPCFSDLLARAASINIRLIACAAIAKN